MALESQIDMGLAPNRSEKQQIDDAKIVDGSPYRGCPNHGDVGERKVQVDRLARLVRRATLALLLIGLYISWSGILWYKSNAGRLPTKQTTDGLIDFDDVLFQFLILRLSDSLFLRLFLVRSSNGIHAFHTSQPTNVLVSRSQWIIIVP